MARTNDQRGADQIWPPNDQGIARLAVVANGGGAENGRALRTLALIAVVVGLVALTSAACVLSYSSVHDFALKAGISSSLARIYPDICDAMLVMAGCSVLALRGAGMLAKLYGWLCFILLLATVAAAGVVHEAGIAISKRATEITTAVFPWALVLVAFGLLLALLRHARRRRQSHRASSPAEGGGLGSTRAELEPPALEAGDLSPLAAELESGTYETEVADGAYEDSGTYGVYEDSGAYEDSEAYGEPSTFEYVTFQAPTARYPAVPLETADDPHGHDVPPAQSPKRALRPTEMQLRARNPRQTQAPDPPATKADVPVPDPGQLTTYTTQPIAELGEATPKAGQSFTETHNPATETETGQPAAQPGTEAGQPGTEAGQPGTEAGQPGTEAGQSGTEAGGPVGGQPTSGYSGDTIPRGEMNAAPTIDQPAEPAADAKRGQPPELDRPRSSPTPPSD